MQKLLYGVGCMIMRCEKNNGGIKWKEPYNKFDDIVKKGDIEFNAAYFLNEEYNNISAVILNHNPFTEDIDKEYCQIYLNPNATIPIDTEKIKEFKYFYMKSYDVNSITFDWHN